MIELTGEGALRVLTIDRPEKANSLTRDMLETLADGVAAIAEDDTANVLILTGRGKVFSAGMDLEAAKDGLATDPVWERLSGAIADAPCLTIAALNGTAAGGSLGMVLATDIRIAAPKTNIFYPVMKLGFLPQPSDPQRLSALVGPARAKLILMGGAKITALEAQAMGLVDRVVDDPFAEAQALATDALNADHAHVAAIKAMLPN